MLYELLDMERVDRISVKLRVPSDADPFDVYRALRVTNPSPYMFHLDFPEAIVTGASPEALVRFDRGEIELRPLAGTRRQPLLHGFVVLAGEQSACDP